ncbi:MAG: O-methyltransferase [Bacteroidales bacterium]
MSDFDQVMPSDMEMYIEKYTSSESACLHALERETHLNVLNPRMLSGAYQGKLLALLSLLIQPTKILELGTYTGYSAICLCKGLQEGGKLITIDRNAELETMARKYFEKAQLTACIDFRIGDAMQVLPQLTDIDFDLVFLDADKENYLAYYEMILPKMKSGGVLLADNVLWSGKVWDESCQDKDTQILRAFNARVHADERVENIILPIRDGISLIRKK